MVRSLRERWDACAARGGPAVADLNRIIEEAMAREGYLSAEEVLRHVEAILDRWESAIAEEPSD